MSLNTGTLRARSLLLVEEVSELAELEGRPELLLDIADKPGEAAALWRERREARPGWSAGALELELDGVLLTDARNHDDLWPLWSYLVAMVEEYVREGVGHCAFPNQDVHVVLRDRDGSTFFTVGDTELDVHERSFVPQLLDAAEAFFRWVVEICDDDAEDELALIDEIRGDFEDAGR